MTARFQARVAVSPMRRQVVGVSLIEVLVTLVILAVGLLGLVGLLIQSQRSQVESYQRAQALIVLDDMVNRINVNRQGASCYAVSMTGGSPDGAKFLGSASPLSGYGPSDTSTAQSLNFCASSAAYRDRALADLREWSGVLLGSAERTAASDNAGVMIGARGCVEALAAPANTYRVSVAWQGIGPTFDATTGSQCASSAYGSDGRLRRVVSTTLQIATLTSP